METSKSSITIETEKDAARYRWLKSRRVLRLERLGHPGKWTRVDGSQFVWPYYLAANGARHAPAETLDEMIDRAMADENFTK